MTLGAGVFSKTMGVALAFEVMFFLLFALDMQKGGAGPWLR